MTLTIMDAIWKQAAFLVSVSEHSLKSPWVKREFEMARFARAATGKRVIAAIAPGGKIPGFLKDEYCADFRKEEEYEKGFEGLVSALKGVKP